MKAWSRSMLDWYAVAMARKYFHGMTVGPESRGFSRDAVGSRPAPRGGYDPVGTHTDWVSWVWWAGSDASPFMDRPNVRADRYPVLNLAMSEYRPHRVIRNIALKNVPLPYESRGSKPQYQMSASLEEARGQHNKDQEVLFFNSAFAMGALSALSA